MKEFLNNENPQEIITNIKEYKIKEINRLIESYDKETEEKQQAIFRSVDNAIVELKNLENTALTEEQKTDMNNLLKELNKIKETI